MKHLSEFFHSLDFIRSRPLFDWAKATPDFLVESTFGIPGKEYVVYLADAREVADSNAGKPVQATLRLPLPEGRYRVRLFSPMSGSYSPAVWLDGGGKAELDLPPFHEDLAIRVSRVDGD